MRRPWTERQTKMAVYLLRSGLSNREIARELDRTPEAIKDHFRIIAMTPDQRESRREAARQWRRRQSEAAHA